MLVIVGSGLAGYALAREIRKRDGSMPVTLVTGDGGEVYSKPMLSNALRQGKTPGDLAQKTAAQAAADMGIEVRTHTRVLSIERASHRLHLADNGTLDYERLVLAVGADPRRCPAPGADTAGVAAVNDLDDYRRWREGLAPGARILLIGAGLIGCEFADDLTAAGHPVALVDPAPWPLARFFPAPLGNALGEAMAARGVRFHLGRGVSRIEAGNAHLDDGRVVAFDRALAAIGLEPRTGLAADAGLATERGGIVVDRLLRTGDPDIYALGDCALTPAGPLPFVAPLLMEARALAATLTGTPTPLSLPALPVVVKTTSLAAVACPPPFLSPPGGTWHMEGQGADLTAILRDPAGAPLGFALTGAHAARHRELVGSMPPLLPAPLPAAA
jgi:rubredoxin-NAD+ reductase